jgi:hypothetical protein
MLITLFICSQKAGYLHCRLVYDRCMDVIVLAMIAFIYFYALKYDDIPKERKWVLSFIPLMIIVWCISVFMG